MEQQEDSASSPWGRGREDGWAGSVLPGNICDIFQILRAGSASGGLAARRKTAT